MPRSVTKIRDVFDNPIDRPIGGVIVADDERNLQSEVSEYVVTEEIAKHLDTLASDYLWNSTSNVVWITGFFGTGKSYFLKLLSLLDSGRFTLRYRIQLGRYLGIFPGRFAKR